MVCIEVVLLGHRAALSTVSDKFMGLLIYHGINIFSSNIQFSQSVPCLISGPQYRHCVLANAICSHRKIRGLSGYENLPFGFIQLSDLLQ